MKRFYYVADWGNEHYLHTDNVMGSAAATWHNGFSPTRLKFSNAIKRLFVDSGGYSMFTKFSQYPYTIEEYINLVNSWRDLYPVSEVAIMDYPCEPHLNREVFETNIERIDQTVTNALDCIDYDSSIPWVPVIQGYTMSEYRYCWERYQEFDLRARLWAIGSICTRKKTGGIRAIVTRIKRLVKQPLHAFGITLPSIEHPEIFFSLESSDSAAWNYYQPSREAKAKSFKAYRKRIERLFTTFEGQATLEEWM